MPFIVAALVVIIDQVTKALCAAAMTEGSRIVLIDGVFELYYVYNDGAAWGMFDNIQIVLYIVSALFTAALIYVYIKYYKKLHTLMRYSLILIVAGAIGNLIDRFALFYVRDMFYISLIDFPVFNVADMSVTIGAALLLIDAFFLKKGRRIVDNLLDNVFVLKKKKSDTTSEISQGDKAGDMVQSGTDGDSQGDKAGDTEQSDTDGDSQE